MQIIEIINVSISGNSSKTEMHENTRGIRNTFVFNSSPKWQFLDQDGHVEKVSVVKAKAMVADAVCVIKGPTGMGTGFRVGDSYIMTAAHVIGKFLPMKGYCLVFLEIHTCFPFVKRRQGLATQTYTRTLTHIHTHTHAHVPTHAHTHTLNF